MRLKSLGLLVLFFALSGCITTRALRIVKESPLKKKPAIGCIETALDNMKEIGLQKFTGSCTHEMQASLVTSRCSPTYIYEYKIPNPVTDQGYSAVITIALKDENPSYTNFFQTHGASHSLLESEKKIIVKALENVDAHLNQVCGLDLTTKLSISDDRPGK